MSRAPDPLRLNQLSSKDEHRTDRPHVVERHFSVPHGDAGVKHRVAKREGVRPLRSAELIHAVVLSPGQHGQARRIADTGGATCQRA